MHGCIDGYSRAIVYIKCFSNNRAGTILQCFMDGIQEFGIPLRVRGDRGAEDVNVARFMIDQKELSRGSFMASLDEFQFPRWNHHGQRTMASMSSLALWYSAFILPRWMTSI